MAAPNPTRASNIALQIPQDYFYSVASMSSSSTALSSPALSSRALYAQTFERPDTAKSLPTRSKHKNMEEFLGPKREVINNESDFNSLPVSVRKKYFSTLERLKFQNSNAASSCSFGDCSQSKSTLADRRGLNVPGIDSRHQKSQRDSGVKSPRRLRKQPRQRSISAADAAWYAKLPDKIKRKHFTPEERALLSARLQEVDAHDNKEDAFYKPSHRPTTSTPPVIPPVTLTSPIATTPTTFTSSLEESKIHATPKTSDGIPSSMYDSFRWIDEEKELDLKLGFDDYHANLDGVAIPSPTSNRRPSFRRHMSVSKLPFGRPSISSITTRPPHQRSPTTPSFPVHTRPLHTRTKSRLSLMAPKHINTEPIMIDPNASHWQDPEARYKLREYLASPQKFDEAIEFGFPAANPEYDMADKENMQPNQTMGTRRKSVMNDMGQTFFNDDTASLIGDDLSSNDPDSPKTPSDMECRSQVHQHSTGPSVSSSGKNSVDFARLGITNKPMLVKQPDLYNQISTGNREMTLRMTLTRPDLRADESAIYGWQNRHHIREDSYSQDDTVVSDEHMDMRGPFGGIDGWGPEEKDTGVVKRVWNKFKGSQRKV